MAESAAASNSDTLRIEFRLPKWMSLVTIGGCVLLVILALAAFVLAFITNKQLRWSSRQWESVFSSSGDWSRLAGVRQPGAALEISDHLIALQCYSEVDRRPGG